MSNKSDRERLEALVAPHIKNFPEIRSHELFWPLVTQCENSIAYAAAAGQEIDFATSHSGFGGPSNSVIIMIEDFPFGIQLTDDRFDKQRFYVVEGGMRVRSIKTDADLLAQLKEYIG